MRTNSTALVYNTLSQARTFRDKFRPGFKIAIVGKKFVLLSLEQIKNLEGSTKPLRIVDETPKLTPYKNLEKWRDAAKRAGCKVKLTTRWAAGGGYYQAIRNGSIVGFYNHGTYTEASGKNRKINGGHLHV